MTETTQQRIERIANKAAIALARETKRDPAIFAYAIQDALTAFAEETEKEVKELREELARVKCGIMSVKATLGSLL